MYFIKVVIFQQIAWKEHTSWTLPCCENSDSDLQRAFWWVLVELDEIQIRSAQTFKQNRCPRMLAKSPHPLDACFPKTSLRRWFARHFSYVLALPSASYTSYKLLKLEPAKCSSTRDSIYLPFKCPHVEYLSRIWPYNNLILTSFYVTSLQDVSEKSCSKYPRLYIPGQTNQMFNRKIFFLSLLYGTLTSLAIFFISYGVFQDRINSDGLETSSVSFFGTVVAAILVVVVNIEVSSKRAIRDLKIRAEDYDSEENVAK